MKQSELVEEMVVGDRVRSLLKYESSRKGKGKDKGDNVFLHDFLGFLARRLLHMFDVLSLSFHSEFLSPNLQLPEHQLRWSPLAPFPRDTENLDLFIVKTHWNNHDNEMCRDDQDVNTCNLKSTQDLLLILNQVRAYIVLSRNFLQFFHLVVRHRRINCQWRFLERVTKTCFHVSPRAIRIKYQRSAFDLSSLVVQAPLTLESKKVLTPEGTFPLWICWNCCARLWYLLLARISLLVRLMNLDAALCRSSSIVSPDWSQGFSSRFLMLSGQAFASRVRRLSLSVPSEFLPSSLQLPKHPLGWSPLAPFPQDWKLRSLHRQHSEPTWKQPQQSNVQMWSRWDCVHFFGTTDLLLILNQVRAHIVLSRKKNGKKHPQNPQNRWSETHVQVWGDATRKELSQENKS